MKTIAVATALFVAIFGLSAGQTAASDISVSSVRRLQGSIGDKKNCPRVTLPTYITMVAGEACGSLAGDPINDTDPLVGLKNALDKRCSSECKAAVDKAVEDWGTCAQEDAAAIAASKKKLAEFSAGTVCIPDDKDSSKLCLKVSFEALQQNDGKTSQEDIWCRPCVQKYMSNVNAIADDGSTVTSAEGDGLKSVVNVYQKICKAGSPSSSAPTTSSGGAATTAAPTSADDSSSSTTPPTATVPGNSSDDASSSSSTTTTKAPTSASVPTTSMAVSSYYSASAGACVAAGAAVLSSFLL